jgi:uncharacterized protein with HEPN domain
MRNDSERLHDILAAVDRILSKTTSGRDGVLADEMLQVWVLHHLQIIGEACRCLSVGFRERNPNDVWSKAAGLRNILAHHYFDIDAEIVWDVVQNDLGPLRRLVLRIIADGPKTE